MTSGMFIRTPGFSKPKKTKTGVLTLRASRSGRICFVAKGSQYSEYSFTFDASHLRPPRLVNSLGPGA